MTDRTADQRTPGVCRHGKPHGADCGSCDLYPDATPRTGQQPAPRCLRCSGFKLYDGKPCDVCKGTGQRPAQPDWREFTDTQRLNWLMDNCGMPAVSRSAIDDAIARDEFRRKP